MCNQINNKIDDKNIILVIEARNLEAIMIQNCDLRDINKTLQGGYKAIK